jgi:hypothetical protein
VHCTHEYVLSSDDDSKLLEAPHPDASTCGQGDHAAPHARQRGGVTSKVSSDHLLLARPPPSEACKQRCQLDSRGAQPARRAWHKVESGKEGLGRRDNTVDVGTQRAAGGTACLARVETGRKRQGGARSA